MAPTSPKANPMPPPRPALTGGGATGTAPGATASTLERLRAGRLCTSTMGVEPVTVIASLGKVTDVDAFCSVLASDAAGAGTCGTTGAALSVRGGVDCTGGCTAPPAGTFGVPATALGLPGTGV